MERMEPSINECAERQGRVAAALADASIATSEALRAVLSQFYRDDPGAWGHLHRVGLMSRHIATELGLDEKEIRVLERAAWLHDVGRLVIPDPPHPGPVFDAHADERRLEQTKVVAEITRNLPFLRPSGELVLGSRECFDGTGGPRGLKGKSIPQGARILHLADVFDVLASFCHELGWSVETVNVELVRHAGARFDPGVVAAWLRCTDAQPAELAGGVMWPQAQA